MIRFSQVAALKDHDLRILFDDGSQVIFPMASNLVQLRFMPLSDDRVWENLIVYPTHLEWNAGQYQVILNCEEVESYLENRMGSEPAGSGADPETICSKGER